MQEYELVYNIAEQAKTLGLDPNEFVESKTVFDLADRVNQMLSLDQFQGFTTRLRDLLRSTSKERAALTIAEEIALGKFGALDTEKALQLSVRAGLAVITDGVTVAPIQGIYTVSIKKNDDKSNYASISYAGPMRSAGGTEAAFSVVIGDFVARKLGLSNYRAREEEIGRYIEEVRVYEREVGNFQYRVSDEDIRTAISNLPVEIDGVETDPVEVVVHRNLPRVSTDRVRGGSLRVLNDGIIGRAHKLAKRLPELDIAGWEWLSQLKGGKQQSSEETEKTGAHFEEVISGRPVLSSPKTRGGFRIRYGRSMNTGHSTIAIHPAVTILLDYPVVIGTQVKVDLPGKAATIAFVDSIEGPTVLLKDGSVRRVNTVEEAEQLYDQTVKILDLGDALISFGDFLENNKTLSPSPYVEEMWNQELEQITDQQNYLEKLAEMGFYKARIRELLDRRPSPITADEALILALELHLPLHPKFAYRFDRLTVSELVRLRERCTIDGPNVVIDVISSSVEESLQELLIPYDRIENRAIISGDPATVTKFLLQLDRHQNTTREYMNSLHMIKELSGITVPPETTDTVGMRVGRPEKAMLRHLKPPVHVLFPVGTTGGSTRDLIIAAKTNTISVDIANITCPSCEKRRLSSKCHVCGEATVRFLSCPRCGQIITQSSEQTCPRCKVEGVTHSAYAFDLKTRLAIALQRISNFEEKPIKGVRGLTSESKTCETIEKGILRSKHDVYVYKDGTIRIDITNAPLTHFRIKDIEVSLETLRNLGYETDVHGDEVRSYEQIVELKPQDIIIPTNVADDLLRIAAFVDEELQSIFHLKSVYNASEITGLLGRKVIGLAPHTSVGVIGRIVGFTNAQVCYANPCWHAAKRRDCDGDGDSILLLLDALLNFSVEYLPNQIGGLMDAPLLIQPIILPAEVDDQAHNFDVAWKYPSKFYEIASTSSNPTIAASLIERIGSRLNDEKQFYAYGFTNETSTITIKRPRSAYSTLNTLTEKISKQIEVAQKIKAVDPKEVVESIIKTHLLRDIMGNMKKYTTQSFKCRKCGRTFRRPTVSGRCNSCREELHATLTKGSVEKYFALARRLAITFDVDEYTKSRLELIEKELDQLFIGRDKSTQLEMTDFA